MTTKQKRASPTPPPSDPWTLVRMVSALASSPKRVQLLQALVPAGASMTVPELAQAADLSAHTTRLALKLLEAAGAVQREPGEDGVTQVFAATPKTRRAMQHLQSAAAIW